MLIKPLFKPIDIFITDLAEAKAKELIEANVLPSSRSYATTPVTSVGAKPPVNEEANWKDGACPTCGSELSAEPDESIDHDGSMSITWLPYCDYCKTFIDLKEATATTP